MILLKEMFAKNKTIFGKLCNHLAHAPFCQNQILAVWLSYGVDTQQDEYGAEESDIGDGLVEHGYRAEERHEGLGAKSCLMQYKVLVLET